MASSKLNKKLYTDITRLKLLDTNTAEVRFRLQKSPFTGDEDADQMAAAQKQEEYVIIGQVFPNSDIYRERSFQIELKLTMTFPMDPPEVKFLTPIYHLNVGKDGKFCAQLLNKNYKWTPDTSLVQIIKAIVDRIDHPDVDYAVSVELGKQYQDDRDEFNRQALQHVRHHGLPR